jgi:hypothetical protein
MDDETDQLEMQLPNMTFRKCPVSMNFTSSADAPACAYVREPLLSSTDSSLTELSKYMALSSEIEPDGMQAVSIL